MKRNRTIKQKIVGYVVSLVFILVLLFTVVMVVSSLISTKVLLLDNMQMMAKISSQNISANLHLLTDRMANLALEEVLVDDTAGQEEKQAVLDERKRRIEFVWLAAYNEQGEKLFGDEKAPASASGIGCFENMRQTNNVTIGEPFSEGGIFQLVVGVPMQKENEAHSYLVGSYKYDLLNDVLSNINIGANGSAYMVNQEGTVIADRDKENMFREQNLYEMYGNDKNNRIFDALTGFQTSSDSLRIHGQYHYIAFAPVAGTNWALVIDAPNRDFMGTATVAIAVVLVLAAVLQVAAIASSKRMSGKISDSLSLATDRLSALAEGNLRDETVIADTGDEAQVMTEALAKTISNIHTYIKALGDTLGELSRGDYSGEVPQHFAGDFKAIREALCSITDSLNGNMQSIHAAAGAVSNNSSEVSDYAERLHAGSEEQEKALKRLNNSIEVITDRIHRIDESASNVNEVVVGAQERVEQGRKQMDAMLGTMGEIYDSMQEINNISHLIDDISSETGMLSLNASIEAARSGEAGKGFAVVAQQIGVLANQTAAALKQTKEMVAQAHASIDKGMKMAETTAESFMDIHEVTKEFTGIAKQIKEVADEQQEAVSLVTDEIDRVQEVANANRELAGKADETAARTLQQAEELKKVVMSVKLR